MIPKEEQKIILQEGICCQVVKDNNKWGYQYGHSAGFKSMEISCLFQANQDLIKPKVKEIKKMVGNLIDSILKRR